MYDYYRRNIPSEFQQIALLNTTTGEVEEKRLAHPDEAEKYYRGLASGGETVRIGMEGPVGTMLF